MAQNNYSEAGFITTSLPDYVENNREIIARNIALGAPTLSRISIQRGVKGAMALNFITDDSPWQSGKGCGFTPDGSDTLSQRIITTGYIKIDRELCPDDLLGKWPEYMVRIPETQRDSLPFEAYLVAEIVNGIEEHLEEVIWQGDTTSLDGYLNKFNGLLKIAGAEATHVAVSIAAGSSARAAIEKMIAAAPYKVMKKGYTIFVSPEFFTALGLELTNANLYHYAPDADLDEIVYPGTRVRIVCTPGLSGTLKLVGSWAPNLYYGTDDVNAQKMVKVKFDEIKDNFALKIRFNAGTQVAFPDWVVIGTMAAAPVSTPVDVALKAIADSSAAIATNVEELADADHIYKTQAQ